MSGEAASEAGDQPGEIVALAARDASSAAIDGLIAGVRSSPGRVSQVVVPPLFARHCVEALRGSGVRVVSIIAYPAGLSKPTIKAIEATSLAKDGVDAIEVTPYPGHVIDRDWDALRAELLEIVRGARAARPSLRIEVRVDLSLPGLNAETLSWLASVVLRSACDGTILDRSSTSPAYDLAELAGETVRIRGTWSFAWCLQIWDSGFGLVG